MQEPGTTGVRAAAAAVWRVRLDLLEALFVVAFVIGVALVYVPAAWMVAGVLGVLWCERASAPGSAVTPRPPAVGERAS